MECKYTDKFSFAPEFIENVLSGNYARQDISFIYGPYCYGLIVVVIQRQLQSQQLCQRQLLNRIQLQQLSHSMLQ